MEPWRKKPLGLRFRKDQESATFWPFSTVGVAASTSQRCDGKSRPWDVGDAEGGLERRDPAIAKIASWRDAFNGLVEIADEDDSAKLQAQVADEQQECDAHRPPPGALVVDVNIGDCEIGARLVGRPAEFAGNHHALDGPCRVPWRTRDLDRRAREVARVEASLLRSTAQWCWVITWRFSARELSVTKPDLSCAQIACHGPLRCEAS